MLDLHLFNFADFGLTLVEHDPCYTCICLTLCCLDLHVLNFTQVAHTFGELQHAELTLVESDRFWTYIRRIIAKPTFVELDLFWTCICRT